MWLWRHFQFQEEGQEKERIVRNKWMENLELCSNSITILNVLRINKFNANGRFKATQTLGDCPLVTHHLLSCFGEKRSYTIWKNTCSSKMLVSLTVVEQNPGCWETALSTVKLQEWSMDGFQSGQVAFPSQSKLWLAWPLSAGLFFYAIKYKEFLINDGPFSSLFSGHVYFTTMDRDDVCVPPKHKLSPLVAVIVWNTTVYCYHYYCACLQLFCSFSLIKPNFRFGHNACVILATKIQL